MFLESLHYSQWAESPKEWKISLSFAPVTLLVGRNATGKTRTLNVIKNLAKLLAKNTRLTEGCFRAQFRNKSERIEYAIEIHDGIVHSEEVRIDNKVMLTRSKDGTGRIYAEEVKDDITFHVVESDPAVPAKRDLHQHHFLEPLIRWAEKTRFYPFGDNMAQRVLVVVDPDRGTELDQSDADQVVAVFRRGQKDHGDKFTSKVQEDMGRLGYPNLKIGVDKVPGVTTSPKLLSPLLGFYVQEKGLAAETWQNEMSNGMFRALSLIVNVRYAELAGLSSCIIVDDIGEGLDFERATLLLELLTKSASESAVQLVVATNDRFIMNAVPVECWRGLIRKGRKIQVISQESDPDLFEEFRFSGLSNFDLFATDFLQSKRRS